MKMSVRSVAILLVLLVAATGFAQEVRQLTSLDYEPGTMRLYERALRAYLKQDFERAEEIVEETLRNEPDAIEAQWLLANIYHKTGRLGQMMQTVAELGIRERTESRYMNELVERGSTGYVLSRRDGFVTIDLRESDGAEAGKRYVVYQEGDILRHPVTLVIVDVDQPGRGIVEVVEVMDTHSIARVVEQIQPLERGMRVIAEEEYRRFSYEREEMGEPSEEGGRLISLSGEFDGVSMAAPEGIALDGEGNFLIADTGNDRVLKLDASGAFVAAFGLSGSGEEEMRAPVSVAVKGDTLYVVERSNHRVHLLGLDELTHRGVIGSRGINAPGMFTVPQKAIAAEEGVFVLDSGNRRVQLIGNDGQILDQEISSDGIENDPTSFALASDALYILDPEAGMAHQFERGSPFAPGEVIELPEELRGESIVDVASFRSGGNEYFAFALDRASQIMITDGTMENVVRTVGGPGRGRGEFSEPVRLLVEGEQLYVLERGNMRVQVIQNLP